MNTSKFFRFLFLCIIALFVGSESLKAQIPEPDCDCNSPSSLSEYCIEYCALPEIGPFTQRDTADIRKFTEQVQSGINNVNTKISALKKELELWEDLMNKYQILMLGSFNNMFNPNFKNDFLDK